MDGQDLMPLYDDPEAKIHESLPLINVWGPGKAHSYAVVTDSWKYIYWPYHDDKISPTEELYDTQRDPQELTELSQVKSASGDLIRMRTLYDAAVRDWKQNAVPYHNYEPFSEHFRRR